MAPKLYILGATGYIGGDALHTIVEAHPDWEITAQVRNSSKAAKVGAVYPKVRFVYGDLDSTDVIEDEASKSDIVYNFANCDHAVSAAAIVKGLGRRIDPGFYIHTSGTMILSEEYIGNDSFGELSSKVYNDWEGVSELTSRPDAAAHREIDKIVLAASTQYQNIKTAIVCPPTIYGVGRGPDNQRSVQVNMATEMTLRQKKGFKVGKGLNVWHQVHVYDLSNLYLRLGEVAVAGGSPATWNDQGYYLAENGEFVWGDVCTKIAHTAHKKDLISSDDVACLSAVEADALSGGLQKMIGTNSRGISIRARKLLDWQPKQPKVEDQIQSIVESEAKALGLIKGHAEKVTE